MKPSWDDAPEWANWLAIDDDGEASWFQYEPVRHTGRYSSFWIPQNGGEMETTRRGYAPYGSVEMTLEPRP